MAIHGYGGLGIGRVDQPLREISSAVLVAFPILASFWDNFFPSA